MRRILNILPLLVTFLLVLVLNSVLGEAPIVGGWLAKDNPVSKLPPLGKLLSPFHGYLQNLRAAELPEGQALEIPGLYEPAEVYFDDRLVPHIHARNDHDLYLAQGYVTAMLRLWQMDTQVRKAGGRLSEFAGPVALPSDRFFVRIGMRQAAERAVEEMAGDTTSANAVQAYTDGVNAYIEQLSYGEYPIEYKIIGYEPEPWTPLKTALLLKLMAWDLTGYNADLTRTMALKDYGLPAVQELYPNYRPFQDPIIPPSRKWEFDPVPLPVEGPENISDTSLFLNDLPRPNPNNGSNNWAISGERSATGYPMLANDPHLNLTLPSIWVEMQLSTPSANTYGVAIPGAPGIIIGFNEHIAWGVTNVGADVQDWYRIKFRNEKRESYWHDGQWKPTEFVEETIAVRGGDTLVERVAWTHHGPVVLEPAGERLRNNTPEGAAMRWLAHDPSNEFLTFYKLNRATNYQDYVAALTTYSCPAQNFVFADVQNNIALWANGKFPRRWADQGKFLLDGTDPRHDWQTYLPHEHNPHVKNPERNFVSSGNQNSTAPDYPYYLGAHWAYWCRGARINEVLRTFGEATVDSMRVLQNDNLNLEARKSLPVLLSYLDSTQLESGPQTEAYNLLRSWDFRYTAESKAASIYEAFSNTFHHRVFSDEFPEPFFEQPGYDVLTALMLRDTAARWYDNTATPGKETLRQQINLAYRQALDTLQERFGEAITADWSWGAVQATYIPHMGFIKPFGRYNLNADGCPLCVSSVKEHNGPSWRMVIALHEDPDKFQAYGIFPGGQSGNPASKFYDNNVQPWVKGELQRLQFYRTKDAASNAASHRLLLQPED